jgi:hypothetical protein
LSKDNIEERPAKHKKFLLGLQCVGLCTSLMQRKDSFEPFNESFGTVNG